MNSRFLRDQIARLSGLVGFPAGDDGRTARKELGVALATATTEYQATQALTTLIQKEQRRYCPTPGEIVASVQATPPRAPKPNQSASGCPHCHGLGWIVKHFRLPDYPHGPREYLSAEEEEQIVQGTAGVGVRYSDAKRCRNHGGGKC